MRALLVLGTITLVSAGPRGYHYDAPVDQFLPASSDNRAVANAPSQLYVPPAASYSAPLVAQQPSPKYIPAARGDPSGLYAAPTEVQQPAQKYLPASQQGYHYNPPVEEILPNNVAPVAQQPAQRYLPAEQASSRGYYYDAPSTPSQLYDTPAVPSDINIKQEQPAQKYFPAEREAPTPVVQFSTASSENRPVGNIPSGLYAAPAETQQPAQKYLPANQQGYHYNPPVEQISSSNVAPVAQQPVQSYLPAEQASSRGYHYDAPSTPSQLYDTPAVPSDINIKQEQPAQKYLPAEREAPTPVVQFSTASSESRPVGNIPSGLYAAPAETQQPAQKYLPANQQGYHYNPPVEQISSSNVAPAAQQPAQRYLPAEQASSRGYHYDAPSTPSQLYDTPAVPSDINIKQEQPAQKYLPAEREAPTPVVQFSTASSENRPMGNIPSGLYAAPVETQQPAQKYLPANQQGYHYNPPVEQISSSNVVPVAQQPAQRYLPAEQASSRGYHYDAPSTPSQLYDTPVVPSDINIKQVQPAQKYLPAEREAPAPSNSAPVKVNQPQQKYLPVKEPAPFYETPEPAPSPSQSYLPAEESHSEPVALPPASSYLPAQSSKVTVSKHFFVQNSKGYIPESQQHSSSQQNKHYRLVFIRAPQTENVQAQQPQSEEKTVIYVLSQKQDNLQYLPPYGSPATIPSQPEVYFIKYRTPEEASRAQQQIQAQYDALSGTPSSYLP